MHGARAFPKNGGTTAPSSNRKRGSLSIVYRPLEQLQLDPKNPRLHSEKQVRQIARSIEVFGFNVPVLVDGQMRVIAGHGRLQACRLLGIGQVPTISLEHLSEAQARAFMIADNRLTENSIWDDRMLGEQLKALSEVELNFSLDVTGFEVGEIDVLIEGLAPAISGQDDPADALPGASSVQVSRKGDLWRLARHRVYCGSALDPSSYPRLMGGRRAAMAFTDPLITWPSPATPVGRDEFSTKTSKWLREK